MFFNLQPQNAILGDINKDLIGTYQQVKKCPSKVFSSLRNFKKGKYEYYRVREIKPHELSPPERAARFIYLNRYCFNGLYRTNRNGMFNVPYGGERTGLLPSDEDLTACSQLLNNVELIPEDFEETLSHARPGDFVYMDPPYRVKSHRVFNEYDALAFTQDDLNRLRSWLIMLTDKKIFFLLSYAESDEANYLCEGFKLERVSVKRNIAGFSNKRCNDYELLINNKYFIYNN